MAVNLFLDVHEVLACSRVRNTRQVAFFKNKGAVITTAKTQRVTASRQKIGIAGKPQFVLPGVLEAVKLLSRTKELKLTIFSDSEQSQIEDFVDKLLKRTFEDEEYKKNESEVRILSNENISEGFANPDLSRQAKEYKLSIGRFQKDIERNLPKGDSLENAVLADNDPIYIGLNQVKRKIQNINIRLGVC